MKVYKNGILVGTTTDGHKPNVLTSTQHWLGRSAWSEDGYLDGTIGFVKIWHGVEHIVPANHPYDEKVHMTFMSLEPRKVLSTSAPSLRSRWLYRVRKPEQALQQVPICVLLLCRVSEGALPAHKKQCKMNRKFELSEQTEDYLFGLRVNYGAYFDRIFAGN
eukprot:CAMPEP_0197551200 /NCGR_PEP_ID=MMETSP1320-20131121/4547_1 /TAXON_ID=91990 /ORGANISM="Bolidomonas sp., Strain RCC2347" /LENGTH=161 /DNA_ID=CAMNT_0043111657 /DNA_START=464 /DNA_END=947 /DNA_ORIENTATION=+